MILGIMAASPSDACAFYRSVLPYTRLSQSDPSLKIVKLSHTPTWSELASVDAMLMHGAFNKNHVDALILAKDLGVKCISDFDDNLLAPPSENDIARILSQDMPRENVSFIVRNSDHVTVSTKSIQEAFLPLSSKVTVIPNAVDWRGLQVLREKSLATDKKFKSVFMRAAYLPQNNSLSRFAKEYSTAVKGSKWAKYFLGGTSLPAGVLVDARTHILGGCGIYDYFRILSETSPTLMHKPLTDNSWNRGKSNITYLEGALVGAATLAPNWEEYQVPGVITYDNVEDYGAKLAGVIKGEFDLDRIASEAWAYIQDELLLTKVNLLRSDLLKTIMEP